MAAGSSISAGPTAPTTSSIDTLDANSCNNIITTPPTPTICIGGGAVTSSNCDDLLTNSMLNGVAAIQQSHNIVVNSGVTLLDCNDLKSPIDQQQSPQSQSQPPKISDLNLGSVTSNGGPGNNSLANILISPAGSGGSGGYMSHSDHSGSVGIGSGNGVNGGRSNTPLWSTAGDDTNHLSMNGFGSFPNFSTPPMFNGGGAGNLSAGLSHQQQRRAITASQQSFPHHGLSPNRSAPLLQTQHQQQQQNQQKNMFNNPYPTWSNAAVVAAAAAAQSAAAAWSAQQHPQSQQQNQQSQWSRGRSVPNLNPPLSGNSGGGGGAGLMSQRKPNSPNPGPSQSPFNVSQSGITGISPLKYRRSTSFPGKSASPAGYSLDVPTIDDGRDPFLAYQDRSGMGNGLDMRSLEHCLSDIMRNVGETNQQDHLKGFLNCNSNTLQSLAQLHGKPYFQGLDDHISEETGGFVDGANLPLNSPARSSPHSQGSEVTERYSRKVFVGGLPPDIDEDEITTSFRRFGPLVVDWPHKAESKSYFPPKGYAFLLFQDEGSVQQLIEACITDEEKLYLCVSSPTIKDKPVQIRPWRLADADFVLDASMPLDPRKTVFVGGVPRPLKAVELAMIMDRLYGGVCYAGIDTDPELKYPKGAGRVAFANQQSYIAAISARFVQLQHGDIDKRVEVKPYVLDDQMCDECQGQRCGGKFAPFFCANVTCLQYYCEHCWATIHSRPGREYHKPLVKEGADRPRAVPFRWC